MKITVVIPTYKRFDYLERLLRSIEKQTYKDFEVIVVDDHSDDQHSYEGVIAKFKHSFTSLTYLTNSQNSGAPHSRNRGINLAKGELIALVDDDDEWLPTKLEKQVAKFDEGNDKLGIVYTWADVVNSKGEKIGENRSSIKGDARSEIINNCFICSPSVMLRKKALVDSELFDETFPSCQDWDMWTRVIFNGYDCDFIAEPLVLYYKHDGPSIGTSPRALLGFKKYYGKHLSKLLRYCQVRHVYRFFKYTLQKV
jgi:glycosyltransferase involved in cell wall biosynthesis